MLSYWSIYCEQSSWNILKLTTWFMFHMLRFSGYWKNKTGFKPKNACSVNGNSDHRPQGWQMIFNMDQHGLLNSASTDMEWILQVNTPLQTRGNGFCVSCFFFMIYLNQSTLNLNPKPKSDMKLEHIPRFQRVQPSPKWTSIHSRAIPISN